MTRKTNALIFPHNRNALPVFDGEIEKLLCIVGYAQMTTEIPRLRFAALPRKPCLD
ncbi:hypothetical protein [Pseudophaeobacter sp.]|jgi:hypothetical protein|uniref:hypothetical protein n=1 Tax=Pseudophaeobacter sp. TaxID=1971739 RepID=UPI003A96DCB8